ncbi:MAG: hypothetical protein KF812_07585 [Fimbriimonadaceae bacterium]|nr:hypothetical protein [Fimbriimonadaceae bacterium]
MRWTILAILTLSILGVFSVGCQQSGEATPTTTENSDNTARPDSGSVDVKVAPEGE